MVSGNTLYSRSHQDTLAPDRDLRPLIAGVECLDFVNTVDRHDATPGFDYFAPGYANLLAWFVHAEFVDDDTARSLLRLARKQPRDASSVRKRAQALRHAIHEIVVDLISGNTPSERDLTTLTVETQRASACGRFVADGNRLTWQWTEDKELDQLLWPIARSAVDTLGSDRIARIRECAADDCQWLFLDTSKNGSRRFCNSSSCGNATRVRRFRARRAKAARTGA